MKIKLSLANAFLVAVVISAVLVDANPTAAQDLVPVSDIGGGSSVFILRSSSRSPKQFALRARTVRTKAQRIESAKRVSRQYTTLAKVTPRRVRVKAVDPKDLPSAAKLKQMSKEEATKLFAGVGEYFMDRDDYIEAITYFREALDLDKNNSVAKNGLSEALSLKGNELLGKDLFPNAKALFNEALLYNPKNAPAYFGLATVLSEMGEEDEAIAKYEDALKEDRELSEIYTPLGILYYQQSESAKQKGDLQLQQAALTKADANLTKAAAFPSADAQTHYFLGLVRYAQGRNDDALIAFRKSATLDPANAEAAYYTGETLARKGDYAASVAEYTNATTLKPNYFEALFGLGTAQYQLGKYTEAAAAFDKSARLRNDNYEAYNNLADSYQKAGNFNLAEANYELAGMFIQRRKDYNKEEAADMFSKAALSLANQCEMNIKKAVPCRWDKAVKHLEQASTLSPGGIDAANLGWAYYNAARADIFYGRPAEAGPKLQKAKLNLEKVAASNEKFVAGPLLSLGMALTDMGDYAGAIDALNKVIKREPKWVFAINELGIAYRKQSNYKEAIAQFKKAIDKDDKFAAAYYNMAEAQFRGGSVADAKKTWDRLKKMGPEGQKLAAKLDVVTNGGLRG